MTLKGNLQLRCYSHWLGVNFITGGLTGILGVVLRYLFTILTKVVAHFHLVMGISALDGLFVEWYTGSPTCSVE